MEPTSGQTRELAAMESWGEDSPAAAGQIAAPLPDPKLYTMRSGLVHTPVTFSSQAVMDEVTGRKDTAPSGSKTFKFFDDLKGSPGQHLSSHLVSDNKGEWKEAYEKLQREIDGERKLEESPQRQSES